MQDFSEEYLPHEAVVYDHPERTPWTDDPWPWCPMAEQRLPAHPGQPIEEWPVWRAAIPHDAHLTNEGNTWCRGVPGTVPGKPLSDLHARIKRARRRAEGTWNTLDLHLRQVEELQSSLAKVEILLGEEKNS